jgi:hypothetical protein
MAQLIEDQFVKMGARAKIALDTKRADTRAWNGRIIRSAQPQPIRVNVLRDGKGEYFEIMHRRDTDLQVVEVRKADRHLLLLARDADNGKSKFLCGHDERAWFVAAIPESATVRNVQDAKDALKPAAVWDAIGAHRLPMHQRDRRWTKAFVRQGEWFFIPRPDVRLEGKPVLRNEPISRGGGKPHICQFLCRFGGEQVYVCSMHPNGLTAAEYQRLDSAELARHRWRVMTRDARVFVKGAIRHSDHQTIRLSNWHEVVMNTETKARAMRHVAFLD